ncbi:hypothetical protein BDF20DRAFT_810913 [Mycotypha africana]|uniref:uncharacterized protein n=1 Tax=Mycotypha africana TaxID=64632 RepID=UPI002301ABB1|nr:uncharacterized protein BDF20DRAFT_810913 [Mycotypha africana]KAI8991681.1 hypothetical protein BDF20DRAFT_810913 [Mycotypha africana]
MSLNIPDFEAKGWFISQEGINLIAETHPEAKSLDDYIQCAKDMDIRSLTTQGFNKTEEKLTQIPSPVVLQVTEVRNISIPSTNQAEQHPRQLSVLLTDGKAKFKAVEMNGKVDGIK